MPYQIKVDLPGTGEGDEVQIPGLGTFKNGSTTELDKDQIELFRAYQRDSNVALEGQSLQEHFAWSEFIEVTGSEEEGEGEGETQVSQATPTEETPVKPETPEPPPATAVAPTQPTQEPATPATPTPGGAGDVLQDTLVKQGEKEGDN